MNVTAIENQAHSLASKAIRTSTLKIGNVVYTFTFTPSWSYDVYSGTEHVITFNTKKITQAKKWLREYLADANSMTACGKRADDHDPGYLTVNGHYHYDNGACDLTA